MIYVTWYMLPLIMLMMLLVVVLFRNVFLNFNKLITSFVGGCAVILFVFYFVIPVPFSEQKRIVSYNESFISNNSQATTGNMQKWKFDHCNGGSLKGYQLFLFKEAFNRDFNASFNETKSIVMSSMSDLDQKKLPLLCDFDFNLKK